jgi:hypothetical protein
MAKIYTLNENGFASLIEQLADYSNSPNQILTRETCAAEITRAEEKFSEVADDHNPYVMVEIGAQKTKTGQPEFIFLNAIHFNAVEIEE